MVKIRDSSAVNKHASAMSEMMSEWLNSVDPVDIWPTCETCSKMGKDSRTCELFKAQPPVRVVVRGCDKYEDRRPNIRAIDDDIPF